MAAKPMTKEQVEKRLGELDEVKPAVETGVTVPNAADGSGSGDGSVAREDRNLRLGKFNYKPQIIVTEEFRHGLAAHVNLPAGELPVRQHVESLLDAAIVKAIDEVSSKGDDFVIRQLREQLKAAEEAKRERARAVKQP